jgi:hypothetical protein
VLSTSLIVTADDVSWFNSANNSFDLFVPSGSTGGNTFNFEVDYMNMPAVAAVSPSTITANGGNNTLVISLNKAFSPQQQGAFGTGNTVNCSCAIAGATLTGTPVPNLDSNGWLTGWNVPFVAPISTTNQTLTVSLMVSGTLTYLSGNAFTTGTVTYINGNVGTITATGVTYVAPVPYNFTVNPSFWTSSTPVTITAQVFTPGGNDPLSVDFSANITLNYSDDFGDTSSSNYTQDIGTSSTPTSSTPATVGGQSGYLQTYSITAIASNIIPESTSDGQGGYSNYNGTLGYTATNEVGGLTCSYTTTTYYETD